MPDGLTCQVAADPVGDNIVTTPDAVMDRAFTINATAEQIWPWLGQLGKQRAGWYLPRSIDLDVVDVFVHELDPHRVHTGVRAQRSQSVQGLIGVELAGSYRRG